MLQSKNKGKVFGISIAAILIFSGCGVKKPVEIHSAAVQETIHATEGAESENETIQVLKADIKEELNWNYIGFWLGSGEVWLMQPVNEELMVESIFNGEERSVMYPGEPGIQAG